MATLEITIKFGRLIQYLKMGWFIAMCKTGRSAETVYRVVPNVEYHDQRFGTNPDVEPDTVVPAEMVKILLKLELISLRRTTMRWPVRKSWQLTPKGGEFRLPPEAFWLPDA